jgi:citrate lyase beta subunit
MLPKVAGVAQISALDLLLTQIEKTMGFEVGRIGIEAQIENAGGLILDAYEWWISAAGGAHGSAMLGDEMIDEASRKMALVIAAKGRAPGMRRTSAFQPPS